MSVLQTPSALTLSLSEKDKRAYASMDVPPPTESPGEIMQNLMAFRNERVLHRRNCDYSGEPILSAYRPRTSFPVYKNDIWWGDQWDPLQYGRAFDFSKPFFEQFAALQGVVPREGTSVFNSENCEYNGHIRQSRNCYMSSLVHQCEDTHYCYWVVNDKDVVDSMLVNNSTLAYECIDCENVYCAVRLQDCNNCRDCHFSYQLTGCSNCIACSNLSHKEYHVLNKAVSKETFESLRDTLLSGELSGWQQGEELYAQMWSAAKHRAVHNLNSEQVIGDHLLNCKNCLMCFDSNEGEDCAYSISFADSKDIRHCYSAGWTRCELVYKSLVSRGSNNIAFSYYTFYSSDLRYCDSSMSAKNCFGCIGLKHKQYCILNKQYTKEEYELLSAKIIDHMKETGEWGRFFPMHLSTFPYNDSAAQDYFPLSDAQAKDLGLNWGSELLWEETKTEAFPLEPVRTLGGELSKSVFACEQTGRPYRVSQQELAFYQKLNIPLPRLCSDARHRRRLGRRNPLQIFSRRCSKTGEEVWSSFAPDRPEKVYSEEAYLDSIL